MLTPRQKKSSARLSQVGVRFRYPTTLAILGGRDHRSALFAGDLRHPHVLVDTEARGQNAQTRPSLGSERDIDVAVAAARKAFKTTWGKNVTGFERSRLLNKLADLIERDAQELAELEALNNGKPVKIARYALCYCDAEANV